MNSPKISIVTPVYNGAKYLEKAIRSIIVQEYPNLEYIIIDGGSTDGSLEIIKKYENQLAYWVSEKDHGMYDALNKGFAQSTGEIMGWLNSDDMLHGGALSTLSEILRIPEVEWVQGLHSWFDEYDRIFQVANVRIRSKYPYLMKQYKKGFSPFIQQESSYWNRLLWEKSGGFISNKYRFAGDFELWMRFFQNGQLFLTGSMIGGFRLTGAGQLSVDNYQHYLDEADMIIDSYPLNDQNIKDIKFLKNELIVDKIPVIRRFRHKRRTELLNEFKYCNWDHRNKKFAIK